MTEKFTPGVWQCKVNKHGKRIIQGDSGRQICLLWNDSAVIANAHLIAAAPELYRAVEELTEHLDLQDGYEPYDSAIKLLAKARGGTD